MDKTLDPFVVLVADDDEDDCFLLEAAFQEMGKRYDLRFVDDGRDLLDYLYHKGNFADPVRYPRPDLILLDLNMPRIDGRSALRIIKADQRLSTIPILILTTSKEQQDIELTKKAGASSFLAKPNGYDALKKMLEEFCTAILHDPNIPFQVVGC